MVDPGRSDSLPRRPRGVIAARLLLIAALLAAAYFAGTRFLSASSVPSSRPLAEEAAVTAEVMGAEVRRIYDVGVAGLHRLLAHREVLREAEVVIVCAGMEGALPSVVGGMVGAPVIAVPTSVGYGAAFGGIAALLGMLNSCSPNVTVVNIDNGFGAAYVASMILRRIHIGSREHSVYNQVS